jgi:putative salt-induced outer membrane protein YdiY
MPVLVLAASLAAWLPAEAQAPAPPPEPLPRFEGSAQFAFLGTTGNASSNTVGAGGEAVWRPDKWVYTAKANFAQIESDDELTARSVAALFRGARTVTERLSLYGQYDFLRDVFAGVEQRHIVEGGVSYLVVDQPRHRLRLDSGLGYLYEQRPDDVEFDSATFSLGASYRLAVSKTSEFTYDPRFLLSFADAGAWRYDQTAALAVAMNSILSLKLAHTIRYSAEPPAGFETTDTITAVSLVAKVVRPK